MTDAYTLITGGSSGIGEACARSFAAEGKNLILIARRSEKLEQIKVELESAHNISVLTFAVDITVSEEIEDVFARIADRTIDVVINNAGLALGKSSFEDYAWEDMQQMIDVNIKAFTHVAKLSIPHVKEAQGHIVNISSIAGVEAYEGGSVYCGSKAYVKMISKALRIDLAGSGVRVTDIAPGAVETDFSNVRFKGDTETAKKVYEGYTPLRPEDIADAITYAITRPKHVNIEYMLIMPTAQASAGRIVKTT